jgi:hypothetical protein
MQEPPECGMEYIHLLMLLGVLLRRASVSRLNWNKHMKNPRDHLMTHLVFEQYCSRVRSLPVPPVPE